MLTGVDTVTRGQAGVDRVTRVLAAADTVQVQVRVDRAPGAGRRDEERHMVSRQQEAVAWRQTPAPNCSLCPVVPWALLPVIVFNAGQCSLTSVDELPL